MSAGLGELLRDPKIVLAPGVYDALGALMALGYRSVTDAQVEGWHLNVLGQVPYLPPNVAGWPLDDRWASTSQIIARTSVLLDWDVPFVFGLAGSEEVGFLDALIDPSMPTVVLPIKKLIR